MNIAELIEKQANLYPDKQAVVLPTRNGSGYDYSYLTFSQFQKRSNQYAQGFLENGITTGMKVLMFVKPSLDFSVITFSLFKIGAVPIFIDPGMGRKNLFKAVKDIQPHAMVAVPQVHYLRKFFKDVFSSVKLSFSTSNVPFTKSLNIQKWRKNEVNVEKLNSIEIHDHDLAAILFTSGGTGSPKGVEYTHHIFATQTQMLQDLFKLKPEDVDIPGFPLFALFTMSMGMTSVIPDMNPSKPAKVNPKRILQNIQDKKATFIAGSPAIWDKVGQYCQKKGIFLPTVKYLVMFGAPVSPRIHEMWKDIIPNGTTYTPYGATECLPISCISGKELEGDKQEKAKEGQGTCIGKPLPTVNVRVIRQKDEVISDIGLVEDCPVGEIGEIIVQSEVVTKGYHQLEDKTKLAKIYDGVKVWHRMGDLGYFDQDGMLWFCGRSTHKVLIEGHIHSPIQSEAIINNLNEVRRSALIPYKKHSAIVIEPKNFLATLPGLNMPLISKVLKQAGKHHKTKHIKRVFFKKSFPVDVRHNIKIDRVKLHKEFEEMSHD